jgi:Ca2+-binding RTX toxin-like protein
VTLDSAGDATLAFAPMPSDSARRPAKLALVAVAAACLLLLVAARPAAAVDVRTSGYWDVIDTTGVDNNVVISEVEPGKVRVTDTAGVSFNFGDCVAESPTSALCTIQYPSLTGASAFLMNAGNDSLTVTRFPWETYANGGAGDDTMTAPFPAEVPMTPFGPGLNMKLEGGPGNDLLIGSEGPDSLFGNEGDDVCLAGAGRDRWGGALGDDLCDGGPGRDKCYGGKGRDRCLGGSGDDTCNGGSGARDRCDGGPGKDRSRHCERSRRFEEQIN